MQFSVYILFSEKFNRYYVGFTSNLLMRFQFGKDWTAGYRPWKIIDTKEFETKTEAMN